MTMANIPDPITRTEQYYAYLAGESSYLPEPITREERYLYYLCVNGSGGGSGGEGMTPEEKQQLQQNTQDIATLKTDKSDKTKIVNHGTNDTTYELPYNEFHIWDEVTTLTLTLKTNAEANKVLEYWFRFTSGATATVLSIPETIKTDIVVEPDTVYECSIVGDYMVFNDWSVG